MTMDIGPSKPPQGTGETLDKNKISDKQKRRADHIEGTLKHQGMGEDHAEKIAEERAFNEMTSGQGGGGNGASDTKKQPTEEK